MRLKQTLWVLCLGFVVTQPACSGPPSHYSAEAIEIQVIDAESKKPLDGVIVTANWQLLGGMEGGLPLGQMMVMETVTDSSGVFRFPAWGPLRRPQGYLREDDPQLLLFKSGYEYRKLSNPVSSKINHDSLRRSQWHGKTIELKPFKGTMEEYSNRFQDLNHEVDRIVSDPPKDCNWKQLPLTIRAMSEERKTLEAKGINPDRLFSIDTELLLNNDYFTAKGGPGCGSPRQFLQGILP